MDDVRICPACGCKTSKVIDSRVHNRYVNKPYFSGDFLYRRRQCQSCEVSWGTYEIPAEMIKFIAHIRKSIEKTRDSMTDIVKLFDESGLDQNDSQEETECS